MRILVLGVGLLCGHAALLVAEETPERAEKDLSHSAAVAVSRTHQAWFREAETQIQAGEYAAAVERLHALLVAEPVFIPQGSGYENSRAAARRLLQSLPGEWLARCEDQFGDAARVKFSEAIRKRDFAALGEVAETYPMTQVGFEAIRLSAVWHFDHGEYLPAAAALQTASEHPRRRNRKTGGLTSADVRRWIAALTRLGLFAEAERVAEQYHATVPAVQTSPRSAVSIPSATPMWKNNADLPAAAAKHLERMEEELRQRGFVPLAGATPLIVKDLVVVRHLEEWAAYDRETGAVRWRKSAETNTVELAGNRNLMANPGFRQMIARQLGTAAFADRSAGTMTSDGSRVFAVLHDHAHEGLTNVPALHLNRNFMEDWNSRRLSCSQVIALDLARGRVLWRVPEFLPHQDPALPKISGLIRDPRPDVFYLGPPTPVGGSLYVVGQKGREIRLDVLSAETGETKWSLPLATAAASLLKDGMRRRLACPVVAHRGLLLCPTGAGVLAAVDPHSQTCRWIARYPREDTPVLSPGGFPAGNPNVHAGTDSWWNGWRDVNLIVEDDAAILCSPESEHLFAVSLSTGAVLWKQPRGDGLFIASGPAGQPLVIGSQSVRALSAKTGRVLWQKSIPLPAGRGATLHADEGSEYLLPIQNGGVLRIDPLRKTARPTFPAGLPPMGNLAAAGETIVGQTNDRVVRLAPLKPESPPPDVAAGQLAWAKTQREAGRFREAAAMLRQLATPTPSAGVEAERQETLLAEVAAHPERAAEIAAELEPLLDSADVRIRAEQALAEAEAQAGHPLAALEFWLKLLEQNPAGDMPRSDDPFLQVTYSRGIQGAIRDLLDTAPPDVRGKLESRLSEYQQAALNRRDPFAVSRLARRFDQLKWGRELIVEEGQRTGIGQTALERQLALWAVTEAAEHPALQALAYRRLMEDRIAELRFSEAAFAYRELQDRFADVTFPDGQTVSEFLKTLPADSPVRKELEPGHSPWPASPPQITRTNRTARLPDFIALPVSAPAGGLSAELDVWLDFERRRLRFSGAGQRGAWEFALAGGQPLLADVRDLTQCWGAGPVLVLQYGSELMGIAPLDDHGEPRPRVLWRLPMFETEGSEIAPSAELAYRQFQPPPGFGIPYGELLDPFRQGIAQVGPVSAGMLAYQTGGRVTAIDPATGRKLWSRATSTRGENQRRRPGRAGDLRGQFARDPAQGFRRPAAGRAACALGESIARMAGPAGFASEGIARRGGVFALGCPGGPRALGTSRGSEIIGLCGGRSAMGVHHAGWRDFALRSRDRTAPRDGTPHRRSKPEPDLRRRGRVPDLSGRRPCETPAGKSGTLADFGRLAPPTSDHRRQLACV